MAEPDAREAFFAALDELRAAARSGTSKYPVSVQTIASGAGVPVSTVRSWFPTNQAIQRTVPRDDDQLIKLVEFLLRRVGRLADLARLDRHTREDWLRRRDGAAATPSTSTHSAVVVGAIPGMPRYFVNRDQITQLADGLDEGRIAVVVTGMRGAGKTQVAAAYARRTLACGGWVGWVNAETSGSLHTDLAAVAERLGVADPDGDSVRSAHRLRDLLNTSPEQRLLVLDNAANPDLVRTLLPTGGGTRVVITSTDRTFTHRGDVIVDAGYGYTPGESDSYLRAATGLDDPDGAQTLAEELGHLPLALAAAATTITPPDGPGLTYATYLARLRAQPLPRALRRRAGGDHPQRVDQAIMLSIRAAEAPTDDPEIDTAVWWLLGLFAFLAPTGIDRTLLALTDPTMNELVDYAIDRCVQHSLLTWTTDNTALSTHRLTSRVLRERARDSNTGEIFLSQALVLIEPRLFEEARAWARKSEGTHLIEQIDALHDCGLTATADTDLQTSILAACNWAVRQLINVADLGRATTQARRTQISHLHLLGPEHPSTLFSSNNLAYAYESAGRLAEAIPLYEQTLADHERVLGPDNPDTLSSRNNLAGAYEAAGRLAEAISLYEQNLTDRERTLTAEDPDTLISRNNLAHAYESAGQLTEAIRLYEQTLACRERVLDHDHIDLLISRNNLASAYQAAGRLTEAIPLFEQNLAAHERVLAPDNPHTLTSRSNLAYAYELVGRLEEAIHILGQVLADRERVLGPDNPNTLAARSNLAYAYYRAERFGEALPLYQRTLADRERVLGPDNPDTLTSRSDVASTHLSVGHPAEAIASLERTLADRERVLSPDHPDTLASRHNLAYAYESVGRLAEAIPLLEQTLADRERVYGPDNHQTLASRNNLASAYDSAGRLDEVISLLEQNLVDWERVLGPDDPDALKGRSILASAYFRAGRPAEAIPLFEQTLADRERVLGPDNPVTCASRSNLACAYYWTGQLAEAIPVYQQILVRRERELGSDHYLSQALHDFLTVMQFWSQ